MHPQPPTTSFTTPPGDASRQHPPPPLVSLVMRVVCWLAASRLQAGNWLVALRLLASIIPPNRCLLTPPTSLGKVFVWPILHTCACQQHLLHSIRVLASAATGGGTMHCIVWHTAATLLDCPCTTAWVVAYLPFCKVGVTGECMLQWCACRGCHSPGCVPRTVPAWTVHWGAFGHTGVAAECIASSAG